MLRLIQKRTLNKYAGFYDAFMQRAKDRKANNSNAESKSIIATNIPINKVSDALVISTDPIKVECCMNGCINWYLNNLFYLS